MTELIKGNWGAIYFEDCLEGMKRMQYRQYDLILTDPPWGHQYNGQKPHGINAQSGHPERVNYDDTFDPDWNLAWFKEVKRIGRRVMIAMGWKNFNWWVQHTNPRGYFFMTFYNGQGQTRVAKHNCVHPWLVYGDDFLRQENKLFRNVLETYIPNGFLRDESHQWKHPSPKPFQDWLAIVEDLHPTSLFDPFAGSGTIAEVGEALAIPWRGFEIDPIYRSDIEYRIRRGQAYNISHRAKQLTLF